MPNMDEGRKRTLAIVAGGGCQDRLGSRRIHNVAVLVEDLPPNQPSSRSGRRRLLLGLFHGVPATQESFFDLRTGPDYVVLYQKNIEAVCSTEAEIRDQMRRLQKADEVAHVRGLRTMERRRELRFNIELPVRVWGTDISGKSFEQDAWTIDLSETGVSGYSGEGERLFRREAERHSGMKMNSSRSEATLA